MDMRRRTEYCLIVDDKWMIMCLSGPVCPCIKTQALYLSFYGGLILYAYHEAASHHDRVAE